MKPSVKIVLTRLILLTVLLAPMFVRAATTNYFSFNDTSLASGAGPSTPANGVTSISGTGLAVGDKIVFDGLVINLPGTTADAWGGINLNNTAAGVSGVTASQMGVLVRSTSGGATGCQIFTNSGAGVNFGPSTGSRTNRVRIELAATIANSTTNMNYTVQVDQGLTGTFNASTSGALTFNGNVIALTFGARTTSHSFQGSLISGSIFTPNSTVGVGDSAVFSVVITNGYPVLGTSQQWLSNGVPISGATGLTYATPAVTAGFSGSQYSVVVTNLLIPANVFTSSVVTLTVRSANTLTWRGVGTVNTNNWDYTATNWVTGGVRTNFVDGDTVTFDDTGTNVFVGLTNVVQPAALTFNSASNYALFGSGGISGSTSLTKSGSGTLTLGVTNAYTGATTISGGTLKLASAAGIAAAPVLYMSFDDVLGANVINEGSGGSALNGVLTGAGATIVSGGRHGNALSISSAGVVANNVRIANAVVPLNTGSSWTVGLWLKTSTAGGTYLYQGDGSFANGNTSFYLNGGNTTAGTKAGGVRHSGGWETGTATLNDGNWHFVVMACYNGSRVSYVDGNVDALVTDSWGTNPTGTGGQFWIGGGGDAGDGNTPLNGLIDEVFVYNRALSQVEIQKMMNASGSLPAASAVSVAAGSKLDLSGFSQTVSGLTGAGTLDTASSTNAVVLTVSNASSGTFSGIITNTAGSLAFVKTGAGALTLSGTNAATGANTVSAGTLNISGSVTAGAGTMTVGNLSGNAVVNFSGVGLTNLNYNVGTVSGAVGAIYQTAGSVRASQGGSGSNFQIGNASGAYGYYYIGSGAVLSANEIGVAGESGAGNGIMDINGGTVNDAGWWVISRTGSAQTGILNVFSGALNYAGGGIVNCWAAGGQIAIVNIMGGTVANTAAVGFNLNQTGNAGNTSVLNLNGGIAQGSTVGGTAARVNFNGGTLRPSAANAAFMTGLGSANIYSGGATIDNNTFAITIAQPLLAPVGSGVNGIASFTGGGGYVAPPIVTVVRGSGDTTGVGATAIAQINPVTGTVTNILITCPGVSYTVTPTFTLSGGGPTNLATITGQAPTPNVSGGVISLGSGTLTLSGVNTFTNNTIIGAGKLALSGSGSLASSGIVVSNGATFDVTATTATYAIASGQSLFNSGTVTGAVTTVSGAKIFAGTDGGYATNTYKTNLTFVSGALAYLDLGTTAAGVNDRINVNGALALTNTVFHVKAPSTSVSLDATTDYVLISAGSISGTPAVTPVFDVSPLNGANFTVVLSGTNVVLRYTATTPPTGAGSASPASVARNQGTFVSVTTTNGSGGTVASVTLDTSSIGGSSALNLISDGAGHYTNTVTVSATTTAGSKTLLATITDTVPLVGTTPIALTVTTANEVWNGAGTADSWSTNANWASGAAPGLAGDSLTFAGTTRLTPSMDTNYSVTGLIFDGTAGAFNIGTPNGSALTLTGVGVTNNSANTQTLNVPVVLGAAQTFNAAAGNLTLSQNVTNGGFAVTVAGVANTVVNGAISGSGTLTKNDAGTLTLGGANTFTGNATISSGTLNMSGSLNAGGGGITLNPANAAAATLNYSGTGAFIRTGQLIAGSVTGGTGTVNVNDAVSVSFGSGISYVGYLSGIGVLNLTNGTFNNVGELQVGGSDTSGTGINGTGAFTMSAGTANLGALTVARGNNNQNTVSGSVTVNGGTLTSTNDIILGFAGNGNMGKLALNGGTVNVGPAAPKWLMLGEYDTSMGELDITNGALNLMNNTSIKFSPGVTATASTNVVNQIGGTVTFYSDAGTTIGGSGDLNLQQSGGSAANNTYNLNGGTLIVPSIGSALTTGTRAFNFNGGTLKPTANNATFMNLGTGNARANVRDGGAIIDSNGKDITIVQALLHSNIGGDAATDGGLTKQGLGTLTLSGANSYGVTTVTAGTLQLSGSGTFGTGTVSNNGALLLVGTRTVTNVITGAGSLTNDATGTLTLTASNSYSGATTINGGLVIATNNALGSSPTVTVISTNTGGALSGTRVTLNAGVITPSGTALSLPSTSTTVRSTLFAAGNSTWGGGLTLNGDNNSGNTIALAGSGGTLTVNGNITGVNFAGTLQLRGSGGGGFGGVINGTVNIGSGTVQVNDGVAWTINSTGNTWAISQIANGTMVVGQNNALPTTTTVRFGLAGNGTLDLGGFNQQVGALAVDGGTDFIINNSTLADSTLTFATNGGASSFGGVIKNGATRNVALNVAAGSLTLTAANTFSGNTTISSGTLALSGGGSITNSANITVNAGALYDVSATTPSNTLALAQTLAGNGSVKGVVTNLGTIAPGIGGIGTLTFSNSPVLKGTVLAEINTASSPTADNVTVNGTLNYGGTLTVANLGPALSGGEVFTLFSATSYLGAFTATNLPALGTGLNWWMGNLVTNGTLVVNVSPTAGDANYTRAKGLSLKIKILDLLTNVTGAVSGKTITLTGVGASTNGATITTNATYIFYTPANDNNESFTYAVSDGRGGSATGTINLSVVSAVSASLAASFAGSTATINGFGIPNYTYVLQTTTNLGGPWWPILTNTAASDGSLNFADPNATNGQQFYRTAQP